MIRIDYLRTLIAFAYGRNPLLYLATVLSVGSVLTELAAMASLLPLASLAAGQPVAPGSWMLSALKVVHAPTDGRSLLLVFVGLFALRVITQFIGQALTLLLSKRLLAQLATGAFETLLTAVPLGEIEQTSIGTYITLVGDESFRASTLVSQINQFLSLALLGALYFAAVCLYSPVVGLSVLGFLVVSFLAMFESFRLSHRLGAVQVEQSQTAGSLFLDALNGLRAVRAYSAESYVVQGYRSQMAAYMRTLFLIDAVSLATRTGPALLLLAAVGLLASWPGPGMAVDLPFLVTLVIFLMRFFPIVGQALGVALRLISDARAGRDVTHLAISYRAAPAGGGSVGPASRPVSNVEARSVDFSYKPTSPVLSDFNLQLRRGQSYALVGLSGSGKSTVLDLLLGFYTPTGGELLVDGVPLAGLPPGQLRQRILLVPQETAIFNDTIANNLCLGVQASAEDLHRACDVACIAEFVSAQPQGFDTVLRYRGSNLSGGQRQRIGIARALLRKPSVLLLDESTSALDGETRARLVKNLQETFRDDILVFVTHDAEIMSQVTQVLQMSELNGSGAHRMGPV